MFIVAVQSFMRKSLYTDFFDIFMYFVYEYFLICLILYTCMNVSNCLIALVKHFGIKTL